ncbi:MAG TPA: hypothetical protein VFU21_11005 [Kofleriaceae bacterium]|nr:hypothetical protein [Kofleriaceae bacterium]
MNPNRRFLYEIIGMGLELETVSPDDVLRHVTPEVLAHHLPVALKAKLLQASLNAEKMTPALVVESIGVEGLVEHSPMPALWSVVRSAVERQLGSLPERVPMAVHGHGNGEEPGVATLKPPKSARPQGTILRQSQRVSALSPRSRVLGRRDEGTTPPPHGGHEPAAAPREEVEFEVVEETDVLKAGGPRVGIVPDDGDTRPGPKS